MNALSHISQIDYTVIFARNLQPMISFYQNVMAFPLIRTLGEGWFEFAVGSNRLALTVYGMVFNDVPPPKAHCLCNSPSGCLRPMSLSAPHACRNEVWT